MSKEFSDWKRNSQPNWRDSSMNYLTVTSGIGERRTYSSFSLLKLSAEKTGKTESARNSTLTWELPYERTARAIENRSYA